MIVVAPGTTKVRTCITSSILAQVKQVKSPSTSKEWISIEWSFVGFKDHTWKLWRSEVRGGLHHNGKGKMSTWPKPL